MKLLTKTNLYYIAVSSLVFIAGSVIFFITVKAWVRDEVTEKLKSQKLIVLDELSTSDSVPESASFFSDHIVFVPKNEPVTNKEFIYDTILWDKYEQELLPYRQLVFETTVNGKAYSVVLSKPLAESDDLIEEITLAFIIFIVALLTSLIFLNKALSRKIWKPFYKTLGQLKAFKLSTAGKEQWDTSNINEFRELNDAIRKMTDKIYKDYVILKQFSENASHEMQTPISIITSKLELLVQADNLTSEQMKLLQDIYESMSRLSKLNQALVLLTRIENKQFLESQEIALQTFTENKLQHFTEFIQHKNLTLITKFSQAPVKIKMNPVLADVLISNLLSNAIKHNVHGGSITVSVSDRCFSVTNTGMPIPFEPDEMYKRFKKGNASTDSLGLGLAIVKEICESYLLDLKYSSSDDLHSFTICFAQN